MAILMRCSGVDIWDNAGRYWINQMIFWAAVLSTPATDLKLLPEESCRFGLHHFLTAGRQSKLGYDLASNGDVGMTRSFQDI